MRPRRFQFSAEYSASAIFWKFRLPVTISVQGANLRFAGKDVFLEITRFDHSVRR